MQMMTGHIIIMTVVAILAVTGLVFLLSYLRRAVSGDADVVLRATALDRIGEAGRAALNPNDERKEQESAELDAYIFIPDIGGYTRFLQLNQLSIGHAQYIISSLLQSVLNAIQDRLQISKIQGDALLLYRAAGENAKRNPSAEDTGAAVASILEAFYRKRRDLERDNACPCGACRHIGRLELKVIVHLGRILRYRLHGYEELSGVPVIVAYRLLKNSIGLDRYVFVTEHAHRDFELPFAAATAPHVERTDVGEIPGRVYSFELEDVMPSEAALAEAGLAVKAVDMAKKIRENARGIGSRTSQVGAD